MWFCNASGPLDIPLTENVLVYIDLQVTYKKPLYYLK